MVPWDNKKVAHNNNNNNNNNNKNMLFMRIHMTSIKTSILFLYSERKITYFIFMYQKVEISFCNLK